MIKMITNLDKIRNESDVEIANERIRSGIDEHGGSLSFVGDFNGIVHPFSYSPEDIEIARLKAVELELKWLHQSVDAEQEDSISVECEGYSEKKESIPPISFSPDGKQLYVNGKSFSFKITESTLKAKEIDE